ncbi:MULTISPECIES: chitin-binding protein [unclassified Mycobacterium]|uniref:chitin-binding protein n=1 Tax=unclassified Mycobacterium TaxID=2642494 RepID=UPI0029C80CDE|nr:MULTISPECIES: chitin-binding protein [unclassified Mycobacterium]
MNLKKAVAGVALAGGVSMALMGAGSGLANAQPGGGGGGGCMPPQCGGPGPGGPGGGHGGPGGPPGGGDFRGGGPGGGPGGQDFHDRGPGGPGGPGDFRGPGGPGGPGDFRGPGGPGDFRGDGHDFGPRPNDAFGGFRGQPWGDGAAPWGWGAPPRAGWGGPFPPPGGVWNQGPVNYFGYNEQPIWDQGQNGWGFYFFGVWIPL